VQLRIHPLALGLKLKLVLQFFGALAQKFNLFEEEPAFCPKLLHFLLDSDLCWLISPVMSLLQFAGELCDLCQSATPLLLPLLHMPFVFGQEPFIDGFEVVELVHE
jgi:hypothetical protein